MRILVISDLPQFVTGGAEAQAARLIEAWLDVGHEVRCFGRRMGAGPVAIGRHSIEVRRIRNTSLFGRWGRAANYFISLAWLLLCHRRWADVIYTRFLGEAAATTALLKALRLLRQPLVSTPANTRGAGGDTQFLASLPFSRALVGLLNRHCDAINLIARDMADELRMTGFTGHNFTHIPNGIPLHPSSPDRNSDPLTFIAVGRLTQQKAYDILLRACAQLHAHNINANWRVWIAGDGAQRESLHALTYELHLESRIEWLGELSPPQIARQLDHAHVFLLPSRYEGMSNAGLEAMERSLPVILSQCGGLDHYINAEMGWVVPVEDVAALTRALENALHTPPTKLMEMGMAARRCVEREFDMQTIGHRYLELFLTLYELNNRT